MECSCETFWFQMNRLAGVFSLPRAEAQLPLLARAAHTNLVGRARKSLTKRSSCLELILRLCRPLAAAGGCVYLICLSCTTPFTANRVGPGLRSPFQTTDFMKAPLQEHLTKELRHFDGISSLLCVSAYCARIDRQPRSEVVSTQCVPRSL